MAAPLASVWINYSAGGFVSLQPHRDPIGLETALAQQVERIIEARVRQEAQLYFDKHVVPGLVKEAKKAITIQLFDTSDRMGMEVSVQLNRRP